MCFLYPSRGQFTADIWVYARYLEHADTVELNDSDHEPFESTKCIQGVK